MTRTLLQDIEDHLRDTGEPPSRIGRLAINDPRFVHDLRNGREARPYTAARVRAYLRPEFGA